MMTDANSLLLLLDFEILYKFVGICIRVSKCQHLAWQFFSKSSCLQFTSLSLNEMELIHEALKTFHELGIRFYVKLGGELSYQTFLSLRCRAEHDSMLTHNSLINEGLQLFLRLDMIRCTIRRNLRNQEHSVFISHQIDQFQDFLIRVKCAIIFKQKCIG